MINYLKLLKKIYQSKIFYILLTLFTFLSFYLIANSLKKESIYNPKQTFFTGEIIKIKKTDYGYSLILKNKENLVVYLDEYLYNLGAIITVFDNRTQEKIDEDIWNKVVEYNLSFGNRARMVNVFGCFKYKPTNNLYIIYADVDTKYNIVYYGSSLYLLQHTTNRYHL